MYIHSQGQASPSEDLVTPIAYTKCRVVGVAELNCAVALGAIMNVVSMYLHDARG